MRQRSAFSVPYNSQCQRMSALTTSRYLSDIWFILTKNEGWIWSDNIRQYSLHFFFIAYTFMLQIQSVSFERKNNWETGSLAWTVNLAFSDKSAHSNHNSPNVNETDLCKMCKTQWLLLWHCHEVFLNSVKPWMTKHLTCISVLGHWANTTKQQSCFS